MFDWVSLETLAVALAIAYLLLAMKENILCWYCAFFSTAIYVWIFGDVSLYMESALNVYYMAMAVYGWYQWRWGGDAHSGIVICRWSFEQHCMALLMILFATSLSGYFLDANTDAKLPYVDSFTTWASIVTTFMVARKVLENWLYWMVINSVSLFMFIDRELYQTAAMLGLYLGLSIVGYIAWRKAYLEQNTTAVTANSV
jgi:nicotinamide mononucleotide transporter